MLLEGVVATDALSSVEVKRPREGAQSPEQGSFRLGQQRVTPVDRRPKGLLARDDGARTGGQQVYDTLAERMPLMPEPLRVERFALVTEFIVRAVADRARLMGRRRKGRPQLDHEDFIANLVAMAAASLVVDLDDPP